MYILKAEINVSHSQLTLFVSYITLTVLMVFSFEFLQPIRTHYPFAADIFLFLFWASLIILKANL